jgi:chorismate synthase
MVAAIDKARRQGDSLGGIIEGIALHVPVGLGEPVFDTMEGDLAKAFYAIPAVKGVEFGAGFAASRMTGSRNNDQLTIKRDKITALSNNAGGISGGISNGMPIVARVAVKPTPSIAKPQKTVDLAKIKEAELAIKGRHDACIVPRAVAVVESMMAITLVDFALRAGLIPRVLK